LPHLETHKPPFIWKALVQVGRNYHYIILKIKGKRKDIMHKNFLLMWA